MPRRVSAFKPTGHLQLGNYLGAVQPMIESQRQVESVGSADPVESVVAIADLHALTVTHDPARYAR